MAGSGQLVATKVLDQWLSELKQNTYTNLLSDPNYYAAQPEGLITTSRPVKFVLGTGLEVLDDVFLAIRDAKHEILFVTCFWATSDSQVSMCSALRDLSAQALAEGRRVRVRLCFSSHSVVQKLTQTSSLSGKEYPPSSWNKFGLPAQSELRGLDLTLRSIFVRPFSVMHSKFVVIDRQRLFLPSCNVSWEDWFEGCIELRGDIVVNFLRFWQEFWGRNEFLPLELRNGNHAEASSDAVVSQPVAALETRTRQTRHISLSSHKTLPTILLPSPHHQNPAFRLLSSSTPPPSPLNIFLSVIFSLAKDSIYIQSPNMTSLPVISAILSALKRGINVKVVTNTRMMVMEQIATAGLLTECALQSLYRKYQQMQKDYTQSDIESRQTRPGILELLYFDSSSEGNSGRTVPAKSHLKLTIVDQEIVVLGSGNMDRASWYTSQEVGLALFDRDLAISIMAGVGENLLGRLRSVYLAK